MRITGGKVFDTEKGFTERDLCVDGGRITESAGGECLNADGCYVWMQALNVYAYTQILGGTES